MLSKLVVSRWMLLLLLIVCFMAQLRDTAGANALASQPNCQTARPGDIQRAIHQKIKDEPSLTSEWRGLIKQHRHLSISFRKEAGGRSVVTIIGFVHSEERKNKVIELVKSVACVDGNNIKTDKFFPTPRVGCDPPNRLCGLVCIGENDPCDLLE